MKGLIGYPSSCLERTSPSTLSEGARAAPLPYRPVITCGVRSLACSSMTGSVMLSFLILPSVWSSFPLGEINLGFRGAVGAPGVCPEGQGVAIAKQQALYHPEAAQITHFIPSLTHESSIKHLLFACSEKAQGESRWGWA